MLAKPKRRKDEQSEIFNKELENLKNQTDLMNRKTEIKNTLEGISSRLDDSEEQISKLEAQYKSPKLNRKKEKIIFKSKDSLRGLWGNTKCTNIHIIKVPEREEAENLFEDITAENFLSLEKKTEFQIQEEQRVLLKMKLKSSTSRHIKTKMAKIKDKERILKAARKIN